MESSSSYPLMWLLGLIVLQALTIQFQISLCTSCLEQERTGVLKIKASMSEYLAFPESWEMYSDDCCDWGGVECNFTTGKVIKLVLSNMLDGWPLNASLFLPFEDLAHLDLSDNSISTCVPNHALGRFCALDKLEVLKLGGNPLNKSILSSLGSHSLKSLSLDNSNFTGSFDVRELSYMSSLEELDLSYNGITDVKGLESLSNLTVLNLCGNKLNESRTILQSNGSFGYSNLLELDLSRNYLEGMIPSWLGKCTSLQFLDLSHIQFEGNLALSPVADLTTLEDLIVSDNNLEIPFSLTSFFNHSKLKVLVADNNRLLSDEEVEFHLRRLIPKFQLRVLSLSNCWSNNLITRLPGFLYHQSDLRIFDLSQINLALPFPTWLLKNNTLLEQCKMRNNSLTGAFQFPSHHRFPQTTVIDVSGNSLVGQVLNKIGRIFPRLVKLDMSGNLFGGRLPTSIGKMKYLQILDLSNNSLSGDISIIHCPSLEFLRLSHNNFSGQLSPSLYNLTFLMYLYLDDNHFIGEIPDSSPAFSLVDLDLSNNYISGKLPRWIGNMTGLFLLAMASNHLEGSIPMEFCNLGDGLGILDLSDNNLSGSIPSCFSPRQMRHVHLNRNKLSGPMTDAFRSSSLLVTLDLLDNNLTGPIPSWIEMLTSLSVLLLKSNNFEGELPQQLCNLKSLSLLDLSQNNLSGRLPLCLSDIPFKTSDEKSRVDWTGWLTARSAVYIDESNFGNSPNVGYPTVGYVPRPANQQVEFSTKFGSYSYKGSVLDLMSGIDLSCNHFSGGIPAGMGSLREIHALNLSHNNLTGPIPTTFSKLTAIESLDLSYNNLNGRIPSELTGLVSLGTFSVAHNNLSGPVPDLKAQFGTFDDKSYEGNPQLCGPPLLNSCSPGTGTGPAKPRAPENEIKQGDSVDFYASCLASYVTVLITIAAILLINPHWRCAWFYIVEVWMTSSYYFVVDNFDRLVNNRRV